MNSRGRVTTVLLTAAALGAAGTGCSGQSPPTAASSGSGPATTSPAAPTGGRQSPPRSPVDASRSPGQTPATVTIAAVGDIACAPDDSDFNDGRGDGDHCRQAATAEAAASLSPDAVLTLGDNQYQDGRLDAFRASFAQSWGRFLNATDPATNRLWPVPGNHEYGNGDAEFAKAPGYWAYFNGGTEESPNPSGVAGRSYQGWYSRSIGSWHVIALNSECNSDTGVECGQGSPQYEWLRQDLAANESKCTLAFWHRPLFTNGKHSGSSAVRPLWELLEKAGAEVVLNGHNHSYERFPPLTSDGSENPNGVREFVVGMGGKSLYSVSEGGNPQSEARNDDTFGVLKLQLASAGYSWQYIPATFDGNGTFTDAGSDACH
ncbi:MAG: hypothetical protein QG671_2169 [Actinomycetota bacterium]|nr:hypothetical protein [Actinomycetota bacterium]